VPDSSVIASVERDAPDRRRAIEESNPAHLTFDQNPGGIRSCRSARRSQAAPHRDQQDHRGNHDQDGRVERFYAVHLALEAPFDGECEH
jgi:hypothetical protein